MVPKFRASAAIAFGVLACCVSPAEDLTSKLLGDWKYDVASLKIEVDPKVKKSMKGDPEAAKKSSKMIKDQLDKLKSNLKPLTVTFKSGGTMMVSSAQNSVTAAWTLKGARIITKIGGGTRQGPAMTLQKDGQKIKMSYLGPGLGTISCFLVRSK